MSMTAHARKAFRLEIVLDKRQNSHSRPGSLAGNLLTQNLPFEPNEADEVIIRNGSESMGPWTNVVGTNVFKKTRIVPRVTRQRRCFSALAQVVKGPEPHQIHGPLPSTPSRIDPNTLFAKELNQLRKSLLNLLGSSHPALTDIAEYYFLHQSKQLRPLLVLLFSGATNGLGRGWNLKSWAAECEGAGGMTEELNAPLSRPDVLNDWNPNMPEHTTSFQNVFSLLPPHSGKTGNPSPPPAAMADAVPKLTSPVSILPSQIRLAQIVEMIHVASLLHDDVIDKSSLRRGAPSAPAAFGNKLSILGGDFLLGRASTALSRLGEVEVVELISSVVTNLVEGEILQMKDVHQRQASLEKEPKANKDMWSAYLRKTYLKTASLMAKGARAAVVLGGSKNGEIWKDIAYAYGRNVGIAFQVRSLHTLVIAPHMSFVQLVDDILDYEAGETTLGKPGGADLRLGLATGPALYAWEEHAAMGPLIERKFEEEGDVELVSWFRIVCLPYLTMFMWHTGKRLGTKICGCRTDS